MATANKLWTDVSTWTATLGANTTEASDSVTWAGNTAAQFTMSGKNHSSTSWIEISGTWESIFGIAPGSLVTLIGTPDDYDWQCLTFTTGAASSAGALELRDSGGTLLLTLATSSSFSGTTSRATKNGTQQTIPVAQIPSATTIRFRLNCSLATGNSSSASNVLDVGHVNVTITYAPLQWWEEGNTDANALFVARRMRVWNAPSQRLNLGDPTIAAGAASVVPLTWSWPYEQVSTVPQPIAKKRWPLTASGAAGSVVPLTWSWPYEQVSTTPPPVSRRTKVPDQGIEVAAPPVAAPVVLNFPFPQDTPPRPPMKRWSFPAQWEARDLALFLWGWEDDGYETPMRQRVVKRMPDQGIEVQPVLVWPPHIPYDSETLPSLLRSVGRRVKVPDQGLEVQAVLVWPVHLEYDPPTRRLPGRPPRPHDQGPEVWIEAPPSWAWMEMLTPVMARSARRATLDPGIEVRSPAAAPTPLLYYDFLSDVLPLRKQPIRRHEPISGASGSERSVTWYDLTGPETKMQVRLVRRHHPIEAGAGSAVAVSGLWGWGDLGSPFHPPHRLFAQGQSVFSGGGSAQIPVPWQTEPGEHHPRMMAMRKWGTDQGTEVSTAPSILPVPLLYYDFVSQTLTARRFIRQVDEAIQQEAPYLPLPYVVLSPELLLLVGVGP